MELRPISVARGIDQKQLDFLRGVAAVYVLINHARGTFYIGGAKIFSDPGSSLIEKLAAIFLQITSLGAEFVILFFVLSGFAMAHSVRFTSDRGRFYLKRVVRIWPPYIAATLFALAIGTAIGSEEIQRRWLEVLFYISPGTEMTPQFWSLPYEVVFYALCPFILASESRIRWLAVGAGVLALGTILIWGPMLNPAPSFIVNFFGNELLFFAAGAFGYYHFDRIPRLTLGKFMAMVLVGLAAVWAVRMMLGGPNMVSSLIMIAMSLLAIRNAPRVPDWANLGYFSYSIYIFHLAVITLLATAVTQMGIEPSDIRNPFAWILAVPFALAACRVLYELTERLSNQMVARIRAKQ